MKQFTHLMRHLRYRRERAASAAALAVGQVNKGRLAPSRLTGAKGKPEQLRKFVPTAFKVLFRYGGCA